MTVASGIAYAAVRLSTDLQQGIISRFRTMPVAPSSVLSGQALSSTLSNLFSCALVIAVAVLVGFRPAARRRGLALVRRPAGPPHPGHHVARHVLRTARQDGRRCRGLQLPPAAADLLQPLVRPDRLDDASAGGFAENQPMTPIIETMRSLDARHSRTRPLDRSRLGRRHPRRSRDPLPAHLPPHHTGPGSPLRRGAHGALPPGPSSTPVREQEPRHARSAMDRSERGPPDHDVRRDGQ